LSWYRKAAHEGYAAAQVNLGLMYARPVLGDHTIQDEDALLVESIVRDLLALVGAPAA
jgi:TPR repeat protein